MGIAIMRLPHLCATQQSLPARMVPQAKVADGGQAIGYFFRMRGGDFRRAAKLAGRGRQRVIALQTKTVGGFNEFGGELGGGAHIPFCARTRGPVAHNGRVGRTQTARQCHEGVLDCSNGCLPAGAARFSVGVRARHRSAMWRDARQGCLHLRFAERRANYPVGRASQAGLESVSASGSPSEPASRQCKNFLSRQI